MKKLFFILTTVAFCLPLLAEASSVCNKYQKFPELRFSTSYGKLRYDTGYSRKQLTALGAEYGILEQGLFASGLATVNVNYQLSVKSVRHQVDANTICVVPSVVDIYIGYRQPMIYIAKDLQPESCEYKVVLRHEQTHQQINTAALEYFIPQLRQAAISIISNTPPIEISHTDEFDAATQELVKHYTRQLEPLITFFKTELLKEQGKLDNYKNYQHEDALCKGF